MSLAPIRFSVRLALVGLSEGNVVEVMSDVQDELNMRPYLESPQVSWDPTARHLVVQSIVTAATPDIAAAFLGDELFETVYAVIAQPTGLHIETLNILSLE